MKKLLIVSLLFASCALPKPRVRPTTAYGFKSVQERIMDCYKLMRRYGASDKNAAEFCKTIYKEEQ